MLDLHSPFFMELSSHILTSINFLYSFPKDIETVVQKVNSLKLLNSIEQRYKNLFKLDEKITNPSHSAHCNLFKSKNPNSI